MACLFIGNCKCSISILQKLVEASLNTYGDWWISNISSILQFENDVSNSLSLPNDKVTLSGPSWLTQSHLSFHIPKRWPQLFLGKVINTKRCTLILRYKIVSTYICCIHLYRQKLQNQNTTIRLFTICANSIYVKLTFCIRPVARHLSLPNQR